MNVLFFQHYTCLLIILPFIFKMTESSVLVYRSTQTPGEFEKFLQGLGSMVYKYEYKKPALARHGDGRQRHIHEYSYATTAPSKILRRNENPYKTKDVLRDVLMMKLVSYYEDKYKITNDDNHDYSTTTDFSNLNKNNMMSTTATTLSQTTDAMVQNGDWYLGRRYEGGDIPEVVIM